MSRARASGEVCPSPADASRRVTPSSWHPWRCDVRDLRRGRTWRDTRSCEYRTYTLSVRSFARTRPPPPPEGVVRGFYFVGPFSSREVYLVFRSVSEERPLRRPSGEVFDDFGSLFGVGASGTSGGRAGGEESPFPAPRLPRPQRGGAPSGVGLAGWSCVRVYVCVFARVCVRGCVFMCARVCT